MVQEKAEGTDDAAAYALNRRVKVHFCSHSSECVFKMGVLVSASTGGSRSGKPSAPLAQMYCLSTYGAIHYLAVIGSCILGCAVGECSIRGPRLFLSLKHEVAGPLRLEGPTKPWLDYVGEREHLTGQAALPGAVLPHLR